MKIKQRHIILVLIALLFPGCARSNHDTVYQVSTIDALVQGLYDGQISIRDLKSHGDFGLGTFHALDGEMVFLDGRVYQVRSDGVACLADDRTTVPFAAVTYFSPDRTLALPSVTNLAGLAGALDNALPTQNIFYAVRVDGKFSYVKTRSVPRQQKPYPPLVEVAKSQPTFEFNNVSGTIIGIRCPQFAKGLNVPAWHFHFITENRSAGGHLLDVRFEGSEVQAQIDPTSEYHLVLPDSPEFYNLNTAQDLQADVKKVEK
jgi:acetolactate decarboxylase